MKVHGIWVCQGKQNLSILCMCMFPSVSSGNWSVAPCNQWVTCCRASVFYYNVEHSTLNVVYVAFSIRQSQWKYAQYKTSAVGVVVGRYRCFHGTYSFHHRPMNIIQWNISVGFQLCANRYLWYTSIESAQSKSVFCSTFSFMISDFKNRVIDFNRSSCPVWSNIQLWFRLEPTTTYLLEKHLNLASFMSKY